MNCILVVLMKLIHLHLLDQKSVLIILIIMFAVGIIL